MIDFIVQAVTFAAWLAFTSPPLTAPKNKAAQAARKVITMLLSGSIGFGFGRAVAEAFLK